MCEQILLLHCMHKSILVSIDSINFFNQSVFVNFSSGIYLKEKYFSIFMYPILLFLKIGANVRNCFSRADLPDHIHQHIVFLSMYAIFWMFIWAITFRGETNVFVFADPDLACCNDSSQISVLINILNALMSARLHCSTPIILGLRQHLFGLQTSIIDFPLLETSKIY